MTTVRRAGNESVAGQALVELLVALGIFSLLSTAVTALAIDALWGQQTSADLTEATAYAQEGIEAARQIADRSWSVMSLGAHGVSVETVGSETRYSFAASSDTRSIYARMVTVDAVFRDGSGNIVTGGGILDADTRKVTASVTWRSGITQRAQQVSLVTYLTNWGSFSWTETLQREFSEGTRASTEVVAAAAPPDGNGSVRLAGAVDWTAPQIRGTFDAEGSGDARAIVVSGGYAYLVLDDGGDGRLLIVDVSDVTAPTLAGSVSLGGPGLQLAVSGGYAYVARLRGDGELVVVDVRAPTSPSVVRTIDLPGSARGQAVAIEGSLLLLGREGNTSGSELTAFTILGSDPSNPSPQGSLNLSGDPTISSLALRSGTAIVGTTSDTAEVQIVDGANPKSLSLQGAVNLSGTTDVTGVTVSGPRAYVTRAGNNEFVVVDISILSNPSVLGELDLGNGANGLAVEGGFAYVAARAQANEFQRVDAGTVGSLQVAGSAAVGAEPLGAFFSGTYAYLATAGNDRELVIIGGGEGGWANPTPLGSVNLSGSKALLAVAVSGDYAYAGREKAEGAGELVALDIREPRLPVLAGQLEVNDAVRAVAVSGHRVFLATDRDSKEFIIASVSTPTSPAELGTFNAPGNADGQSVFVMGNSAVLTTRANSGGAEVYLLDVSNPAAPSLQGSINLPGNPDVSAVTGTATTLFLATSDSARDIQVYDSTNPAAPAFLGAYDTSGSGNALSVALRGTELYVGTKNNGGGVQPEFFILDVRTPAAPNLVSTGSAFDVGGDISGLDVSGTVAFIGTNREDREFQTLNISSLASPALLGAEEIDDPVTAVTIGGTYAYLATRDDDAEFQIYKSADASGFATAGTYDSIPFDSGSATTVWDSLSWNAALSGGTVRFQLRRGDTQPALESALFQGPDGTVSTYYQTSPVSLTLPASVDPLPGRWIQWRAYLDGTQAASPELQDVTVTFRQ